MPKLHWFMRGVFRSQLSVITLETGGGGLPDRQLDLTATAWAYSDSM